MSWDKIRIWHHIKKILQLNKTKPQLAKINKSKSNLKNFMILFLFYSTHSMNKRIKTLKLASYELKTLIFQHSHKTQTLTITNFTLGEKHWDIEI